MERNGQHHCPRCPGGLPRRNQGVAEAWEEANRKIEDTTTRISQLVDAQLSHHLLRACLDGCRVNHLLRATDTYSVDCVSSCSETILQTFEDLLGQPLTQPQRLQASLPLSNGGCGLRVPSFHRPAARIAALASFYSGGATKVGTPAYAQQADLSILRPPIQELVSRLGPNHHQATRLSTNPATLQTAGDISSQKWWSHELGTKPIDDLMQQASARDQARLLEQSNSSGSGWMAILPSVATQSVISSDEYTLGLKWHLGMPVVIDTSTPCPDAQAQ
jgi:hypothetical protein